MGVRRYQDLIAWQLADQFNEAVHTLVIDNPHASKDWRYRSQILDAASSVPANIAEGFLRFSPREFARFLSYAIASLAEAEGRIRDGVRRRYFDDERSSTAFQLARRCLTAAVRLRRSQLRPQPPRR